MKSKAYLFFIIYLCLAGESFSETIITLNTTGNPPLNTPDQSGFLDLISKEIFSRLNITLHTVQLPAERGLINANNGTEDGEMSRIEGLEKTYGNLIRVPEKIMDWDFVVFSPLDLDLSDGWTSLKPYSISYINGWKILENNLDFPGVIKVHSPDQLFTLLAKNRTDVIVYERWAGLLLKRQRNLNAIKIANPPLAIKPMFIYLNKKHAALVTPLSEALKEIKKDGSYQRIVNQVLTPLEN